MLIIKSTLLFSNYVGKVFSKQFKIKHLNWTEINLCLRQVCKTQFLSKDDYSDLLNNLTFSFQTCIWKQCTPCPCLSDISAQPLLSGSGKERSLLSHLISPGSWAQDHKCCLTNHSFQNCAQILAALRNKKINVSMIQEENICVLDHRQRQKAISKVWIVFISFLSLSC